MRHILYTLTLILFISHITYAEDQKIVPFQLTPDEPNTVIVTLFSLNTSEEFRKNNKGKSLIVMERRWVRKDSIIAVHKAPNVYISERYSLPVFGTELTLSTGEKITAGIRVRQEKDHKMALEMTQLIPSAWIAYMCFENKSFAEAEKAGMKLK